ncbi:MAG: hypothetical protein J0M19_11325, partial [Sphingomonadales bacterium]|nr:hypothetical protein [Sphingomonadales bacterium]
MAMDGIETGRGFAIDGFGSGDNDLFESGGLQGWRAGFRSALLEERPDFSSQSVDAVIGASTGGSIFGYAAPITVTAQGDTQTAPDASSVPTPDAIMTGSGAISLTALDSAATQDFDTLASTSTSSTMPTGWYFDETSTTSPGNTLYTAGTGSGNAGDTYSFGASGSSERALGGLRSGSNVPTIGAQFTNNTGSDIGSLDISYVGEQWRLGTLGRADSLVFQISFDATSLTSGTWTTVSQLNFTAPTTTGTVGLLNGNLAANQAAISFNLILATAIASGQTFWIRWTDTDASGSDDGLGIDNFSITPHAAVPSAGSLSIDDVTMTEGNSGTTTYTFTVTRSGGTAGAVSADWNLAHGTTDNADFTVFPQSGTVNFADGANSATVTVTVAGDTAFEGNENFAINLSNPTGGVTFADAQGQGTITNDDAAPVAELSINDVSQAEGNTGITTVTFTVTRGGDTSIA